MKNLHDTKKDYRLFRNKSTTTPFVHQFIALASALSPVKNQLPEPNTLNKTGSKSPLNKSLISLKKQLAAEWNTMLPVKEDAGLARSIVFFNWKNYA